MEKIGLKLSTKHRRVYKKQMKFKELLLRHEQISCCETPSTNIAVANGGLSNGVEREQLWNLFAKHGHVVDVVMKPNKPYAFIIFKSVDEAVRAMDAINGHRVDVQEDSPILYLLYVENFNYTSFTPTYNIYTASDDLPKGLTVLLNFISEDDEFDLIKDVDWQSVSGDSLKHRRVLHFGYRFLYDKNDIDRQPLDNKIPASCIRILTKLLEQNLISSIPDQLTVNEYQPGQGIPPHVDTHSAFEDTIIIFNLQSQITLEFRHDSNHVHVILPHLSVVLMSDASRYQWTHGITPRTMDIVPAGCGGLTLFRRQTRISFTFRTVRSSAVCHCAYPDQCDSQQHRHIKPSIGADSCTVTNNKLTHIEDGVSACQLESDYVHKVYETIASHFSDTRHSPWPRVAAFIRQLPTGAILADIGCGNGKYLGLNHHVYTVGCDRSTSLCDICNQRGYESFVADSLSLPVRDNVCDAVLCIAVIHHMSTPARRHDAVCEIIRILCVGGQALIYVWALEQERENVRSKYLKKLSTNVPSDRQSSEKLPPGELNKDDVPSLPLHVNRTAFEAQDIFVPWHLKQSKTHENLAVTADSNSGSTSTVLRRFYHMFIEGELEDLCKTVNGINIVDSYYDQGNWCIVLQKTN